MSSDLDVPLLPSAEQIRKRGFVTVRKGGFDPDQVREFLGRVADQVEVLEKESRELRMATGSKQAQGQGQPTAAGEDAGRRSVRRDLEAVRRPPGERRP